MLIALYIILGLVLLVALLLLLRINVWVVYDEKFVVRLKVLFFGYYLVGGKEKKIKSMSARKLRKLMTEEAEEAEERDKVGKKQSRLKEMFVPDGASKRDMLNFFLDMIRNVVTQFAGYLDIYIKKLHVRIGSDNASTTAMKYTAAMTGVATLFEIADEYSNLTIKSYDSVKIEPDFTSEDIKLKATIRFSIRVWQALKVVWIAWSTLKKSKHKQNIGEKNNGKQH